ncbi:MAG: glycosyltransferase [Rubrobacteraceae bacterium]
MKIAHVITGLSTGGAEMALYKLLSQMDREAFDPEVISLTDAGEVAEKIRQLGIPVQALGMRRGVPNPLFVIRLARLLRKTRPDVVQTWMYHADLVGGLSTKLAGSPPVAWNVRHSHLDPRHTNRTTLLTARACALLSGLLPRRIVCVAEVALWAHVGLGYDAGKMVVIPNGFDLSLFYPDQEARSSVREELALPTDTPLVGLVARSHPDKDHSNFLEAASPVHAANPETHFLLCGEGVDPQNTPLVRQIENRGIRDRCHLLGRREDTPRLTAALDVAVSSSSSEGFPNAVGEAMSCGVPCVVTDVGDSAAIVGDTGGVVPARDRVALARGIGEVLALETAARRDLGERARRRIREHYSLESVASAYETLYREMVPTPRNKRPA